MNEHEKIVIGTILSEPHAILRYQFVPEDFSPELRPLWNTIHSLFLSGQLSLQAVVAKLQEDKTIDTLGDENLRGTDFVYNLLAYADSNGFDIAANALIEKTTKQKILEIAVALGAEARNGRAAMDIIASAIENLQNLRRKKEEGKLIGELLPGFKEKMLKIRKGETIDGWEPNLEPIRRITGPTAQTDFVIVAGYGGGGKSSLLRYEAINTAMNGGVVITFNGENDPEWYLRYGIAYISHITEGLKLSTSVLKWPQKMTPEQWARFDECAEKLRELPWIIEPIKSINEMKFDVLRYKYRFGQVELVQIDQIQNMSDTSFESIESATYALRNMAMDLGVPVMAAHQLRKPDKNEVRQPDQEDLLYAGTHAAKQIWIVSERKVTKNALKLFIENIDPITNEVMEEENCPVKVVTVKIAKNSSGPTGKTGDIAWYKGYNNFRELEPGWAERATATFRAPAIPSLANRPVRPAPKPTREK
jgi:replicative DNA helicase